jgi:hypothetical protein
MSIQIGPYELRYATYSWRDPADGMDKDRTDLFISLPDGESMGCNPENEKALIEMLDAFWKQEF